jgi:hypothetical protein
MSNKTVFVLWGWYEGADPLDQKILGVFESEEQATEERDTYSYSGSIFAFVLYEAYLGRAWESSLPGEVPHQIYFVTRSDYTNKFEPTDMVKVRAILEEQKKEYDSKTT